MQRRLPAESSFLMIIMVSMIVWSHARFNRHPTLSTYANKSIVVSKNLVVNKSGGGDFKTVQGAIDSIPQNNDAWVRVLVHPGIYNEKVVIPIDKPYVILQGKSALDTIIQSDGVGGAYQSTTFSALAENFHARNIQFKNTRQPRGNGALDIAPAAYVGADKASFYQCMFIGLQDTLTDIRGHHYFESCYIEGAVDFIWGGGQSVYQDCTINATTHVLGRGVSGFITAQGRSSTADNSGYIFNQGHVIGTGPVLLGRAYRPYSRVVFKMTKFSSIVAPEGWSAWNNAGQERGITFAEAMCTGPGANKAKRVKWMKTLTSQELEALTNVKTFIDRDGWLSEQSLLTHGFSFSSIIW